MSYMKSLLSLLLFLIALNCGYRLITIAKINQTLKADYAEIQHFKYGLFSVNEWKRQISKIVIYEIDKITLTRENQNALRDQLKVQLTILIEKVMERIHKFHYDSLQGQIKLGLFKTFVDVGDIKKGVPEYADAILKEIKKSRTQDQIKSIIKNKILDYMAKTFDTVDDTKRKDILKKTNSKTHAEASFKIQQEVSDNYKKIRKWAFILIIIAIIMFLFEAPEKKPLQPTQYYLLTLTLLILLISGITTPMIDMEAKISEFTFILLDQKIHFKNQVLYFQSKSIQDVFWIMITHQDYEMKFVGILMVCFSIVFPVFKLLSSMVYYYDYCKAREYKIVQFFVLKSGKWSMADVLVVAIFMSYIGFNGIINSQMDDLRTSKESLNVMTTNGTNLQPGFYLFLTYSILAMLLSGILKKRPYKYREE